MGKCRCLLLNELNCFLGHSYPQEAFFFPPTFLVFCNKSIQMTPLADTSVLATVKSLLYPTGDTTVLLPTQMPQPEEGWFFCFTVSP